MASGEQAQPLRADQGVTFDGIVSAKESEVMPGLIKRAAIWLYCHRMLPASIVSRIFSAMELKRA